MLLEMPLNRLGLIVEYHNINDTDYPEAGQYRGIVVWFDNSISDYGKEYYAFLEQAVDAGVKVILMNGPGFDQNSHGDSYQPEIESLLKKIGLGEGEVEFSSNPFAVEYTKLKQEAFGFETDEAVDIPVYRDL